MWSVLQWIVALQTEQERAGYACQPQSLWPAGRPCTWRACPLRFVHLSVFPHLMERKNGLQRQCQPQQHKRS